MLPKFSKSNPKRRAVIPPLNFSVGVVTNFFMKYRTALVFAFALTLLFTIGTIKEVAEAAKSVEYAFEAELGKIIAPIKADKDKNASNGQFVSAPAGVGNFVGAVEFKILIPKKADYYIWGKVIGTDGGNDSYFVTWDGESKGDNNGVNVWDTTITAAWQWDMVMGRGHSDPKAFELKPGEHVLTIWGREDDTKLDCLFMSDDQKAVPREPSKKEIASQKPNSVIGGLAVEATGKLATTWGEIKQRSR
jgi:hypothetical protein